MFKNIHNVHDLVLSGGQVRVFTLSKMKQAKLKGLNSQRRATNSPTINQGAIADPFRYR